MSLDPQRLEDLVAQLIHAAPSQWEQLCARATDDVSMREVATNQARAFLDEPEDAPVSEELEGKKYGRFHFIRELGAGGFGEVWLARDEELNRWVAVKFLHSRDQHHRKHLVREAQTLARVPHDNIVTVHQVADIEQLNKSAIVMELCSDNVERLEPPSDEELGKPLSRVVRATKPNYRRIASQMQTISQAVGAAHDLDVIHGDLKPGNVLITPQGKLLVTDFGLGLAGSPQPPGRRHDGTASISVLLPNGNIRGTPHYMSPEQAVGAKATRRSDVYSLGSTFYYLLTGQTPYAGESELEIIEAVATGLYRPFPRFVPRQLAHICRKAMALTPANRYRDANELAQALQRLLLWDARIKVTKAATAVLLVATIALGITQWLARHVEFGGGPDDSVVVQRGLPWFRFPLPDRRVYHVGLTAADVLPSKRSALVNDLHWLWNRPESPRVRQLLSNLRPTSEISWQSYAGDWTRTAALYRQALTDELPEAEVVSTRNAWTKILPLAPASAIPFILLLLKDDSALVRENATTALGVVGRHSPKEAIDALINSFNEETLHAIRWSAVLAIGELAPREPSTALPFLISLAKDPENEFQSAAGMALNAAARYSPDEIASAVLPLLRESNADTLQVALAAIDSIEGPASKIFLADVIRIAQSDMSDPGILAIDLLGSIGAMSEQEIIPILRMHLKAGSSLRQQAALRALGHLGPAATNACLDLVHPLLAGEDEGLAQPALSTVILGRAEWDERFERTLLAGLNPENSPAWNLIAAWAAGNAKQKYVEPFVEPLLRLLNYDQADSNFVATERQRFRQSEIRSAAARALGALANEAPTSVIPHLLLALSDIEDPKRRQGAAEAFQFVNPEHALDAVEPLCRIVENSRELYMVRQSALVALAAIGPADVSRAVKSVAPVVWDDDERFSLEAAQALGKWGAAAFSEVQAQLVAAATASEAKTRRAAAVAWATFASRGETNNELGKSVGKLLQDESPIVREAAVEANGEWLLARCQVLNNPGSMLASLLTELQSDRSRYDASYRASVAYALSRAQRHLEDGNTQANSATLNDCRTQLRALRETSEELWLRAAAFQSSL